jgi:hypothetical protein
MTSSGFDEMLCFDMDILNPEWIDNWSLFWNAASGCHGISKCISQKKVIFKRKKILYITTYEFVCKDEIWKMGE